MSLLVAYYLVALAFGVAGLILWQYWRGTHDLLSLRNVILVGFTVFQLTGAALDIILGAPRGAFTLERLESTSVIYGGMATLMLALFLLSYHKGYIASGLGARMPTARALPSLTALWTIAVGTTAMAGFLRLGLVPIPPQIGQILSVTFGAVACGIVGWIWAPRLFNPIVLVGAGVIVLAVFVIVTTGSFGRRPLIAICGALVWGMYYSHFRYMRPSWVLPRFAAIAAIPVIVVALFTSARTNTEKGRTGFEQITAIAQRGDLSDGLYQLAAGQGAGAISMWLIEQYPAFGQGRFESRPLFSVYYFMVLPIPRAIWTGKPQPLSQQLPHMAAVSRVNRDRLTLSAGVIGHAAAEGGWFALIVYAILGGLLIRFFDEIVRHNAWSPFVVLAVGSTLGHLLGIPRGETAVMAMLFALGSTLTYGCMVVLGKLLERVYGTPPELYEGEGEADGHYEEEWNDSSAHQSAIHHV